MRIKKYFILAVLAIVGGTFGISADASAQYSYNQIENMLIGGNSRAVSWELQMFNNMKNNLSAGLGPRTSVNNGGSYSQGTWVSAAGQGSRTTIEVPYGTRVVNLQLNSVTMLSSALVQATGAGVYYPYSNYRVVRSDNAPNDRRPNGIYSAGPNNPALTSARFRVDGGSSSNGGAVTLTPNTVLVKNRSDTTRYWFASPLRFTYVHPTSSGFTDTENVTVTVRGRDMAQYWGSGAVCVASGQNQPSGVGAWTYGRCPVSVSNLSIRINVARTFNLQPTVNGSPSFADPGEVVSVDPRINNTGPTTSASAEWRMVRYTIPAANRGDSLPSSTVNGTFPTTHFGYGATTIANGDRTFPVNGNTVVTNLSAANRTIPDLPVDTRICYALSVRPATQATANWRHSAPFCVTVAKSPKFVVKGGDLLAGREGSGTIRTSTKTVAASNRTYGSWGEYAVSATGVVEGIASASGYSGGRLNSTTCNVAYLTISNAGTNSCTATTVFGGYANLPTFPALNSRFDDPRPNAPAALNLSTAPNETIYGGTGTIRVTAPSAIGAGRWIVLNAPSANVIIDGNIRYTTASLDNVNQIPQIIIIANTISINPNVQQVDAWLMATGTTGRINTCNEVANFSQVRNTNCDNPLTINGPVAARTIELRRTFGSGSGSQSGVPAEIINLRPDAYLWATNYNANSGRVPTVSTQELPPRF